MLMCPENVMLQDKWKSSLFSVDSWDGTWIGARSNFWSVSTWNHAWNVDIFFIRFLHLLELTITTLELRHWAQKMLLAGAQGHWISVCSTMALYGMVSEWGLGTSFMMLMATEWLLRQTTWQAKPIIGKLGVKQNRCSNKNRLHNQCQTMQFLASVDVHSTPIYAKIGTDLCSVSLDNSYFNASQHDFWCQLV